MVEMIKGMMPGPIGDFYGEMAGQMKAFVTDAESLTFAAFVYWVFCFGMSRYSMALERKLHTGHKR